MLIVGISCCIIKAVIVPQQHDNRFYTPNSKFVFQIPSASFILAIISARISELLHQFKHMAPGQNCNSLSQN
jgi:hypothetical protein